MQFAIACKAAAPGAWPKPMDRAISLVLPWFEADNYCGFRGTVRVPMLVRILRTYELPEILMLTTATLCVVVSVAYLSGG